MNSAYHARCVGRPALGFTLVEVMVALAVVAFALPALMFALAQQVDGTGYLRDKTIAEMVAANKLQELRILSQASRNLLQGQDSGVSTMVEREWYWWLSSQPTEADNFYRIEIEVATEEDQRDQSLVTLVAFMSADLQIAPPAGGGEGGGGGESGGEGQ